MRIVIDMNLSPLWQTAFAAHGVEAVHWAQIGPPDADDEDIQAWARANNYVVLTCDLDFGRLLAISRAQGPSTVLLRLQDLDWERYGDLVVGEIASHERALVSGAMLVIDANRSRVRLLPLH